MSVALFDSGGDRDVRAAKVSLLGVNREAVRQAEKTERLSEDPGGEKRRRWYE
jgi:hypothetical protein